MLIFKKKRQKEHIQYKKFKKLEKEKEIKGIAITICLFLSSFTFIAMHHNCSISSLRTLINEQVSVWDIKQEV